MIVAYDGSSSTMEALLIEGAPMLESPLAELADSLKEVR
jgi:hypothetical protein